MDSIKGNKNDEAGKNDVFASKVVPIMDKMAEELGRKQNEELSSVSPLAFASPTIPAASLNMRTEFVRRYGEWNSKTTEDYLKMVIEELKRQHIKVDTVMEEKMVDYLIEKEVPKSSVEYVLKNGLFDSMLFGSAFQPKSKLDAHIRSESNDRYDASWKEKGAVFLTNMALDSPTMLTPNGWATAAVFVGDLIVGVKKNVDVSVKAGKWKEEEAQKAVDELDSALKASVTVPQWMMQKHFGKGSSLSTLSEPATDEQLMKLQTAFNWSMKNMEFYKNEAKKAVDNGCRTITISGKKISLYDATIRAREYEEYGKTLVQKANELQRMKIAGEYSADGVTLVPRWLYMKAGIKSSADLDEATDKQLQNALHFSESNRKVYERELEKSMKQDFVLMAGIKIGKQEISFNDAVIRIEQYKAFEDSIKEEQRRRIEGVKVSEAEEQSVSITSSVDETNVQSQTTQAGTDGWKQMLSSYGLTGGKHSMFDHLGYTLATMPDMLYNFFSGKSNALDLNKQTMIPFAAILLGLFVHNPILKFALIGLGGGNLLSRLHSEQIDKMEQGNTTRSVSSYSEFVQYQNQELNPRISNVKIENGVFFADVDRVPCVVQLTKNLASSVESGALPLNTLADAMLSKIDSQRMEQTVDSSVHASQTYARSQQQEQGVKIK